MSKSGIHNIVDLYQDLNKIEESKWTNRERERKAELDLAIAKLGEHCKSTMVLLPGGIDMIRDMQTAWKRLDSILRDLHISEDQRPMWADKCYVDDAFVSLLSFVDGEVGQVPVEGVGAVGPAPKKKRIIDEVVDKMIEDSKADSKNDAVQLGALFRAGLEFVMNNGGHYSDCSVNNGPALTPGPCDCGFAVKAPEPETGGDFGDAIEAMRNGRKVARAGWNGKGMYAYYVPAAVKYVATTDTAKEAFGGALVPYRPYLALKTAQNDVATWSPSTSDVFADDWFIVD